MENQVRDEQATNGKGSAPDGVRLSIVFRGLTVLFFSSLPLLFGAVLAIYLSVSQSDTAVAISNFLSAREMIAGNMIPQWLVAMLFLLALTACFGYFSIDYFFMRPIKLLHAWMKLANEFQFEHFAEPRYLGRDEIGGLGRQLSAAAALVGKVRNDNKLLLQEKSLFITIAAHQLRTPLTGLLWSIDSLLDPATAEDQRHTLMKDVDSLLKRMRLIINHILASANVEGGKYGYVFEQVDIVPIIAKLVDEFKPVSDAHGVTVKFEHPDIGASVYADSERISLAIFDLMSNAIDYTPPGGSVTVSVVMINDRYEIAVADTGIGISETELPNLFNKFYRSDRARHVRPDGSGLGLYLVREIISSHGSTITVKSKEGSGSRFSFLLSSKKF